MARPRNDRLALGPARAALDLALFLTALALLMALAYLAMPAPAAAAGCSTPVATWAIVQRGQPAIVQLDSGFIRVTIDHRRRDRLQVGGGYVGRGGPWLELFDTSLGRGWLQTRAGLALAPGHPAWLAITSSHTDAIFVRVERCG